MKGSYWLGFSMLWICGDDSRIDNVLVREFIILGSPRVSNDKPYDLATAFNPSPPTASRFLTRYCVRSTRNVNITSLSDTQLAAPSPKHEIYSSSRVMVHRFHELFMYLILYMIYIVISDVTRFYITCFEYPTFCLIAQQHSLWFRMEFY